MSKAKVLVIGSGGREHAIAHAIALSSQVGSVFAAPGNAGVAQVATLVPIDTGKPEDVLRFVEEKKIALTVVGPEAPLVAGLADALRAKGHLVVGASQEAAMLEGSKAFAKHFMSTYGIPTARFQIFDDASKARDFVNSSEGASSWVLKADGLAAGKGVMIPKTKPDLLNAIKTVMEEKAFGAAGEKIVLEERLQGPEVSLMALTDGNILLPFPASQDHKRVFNGDKGPNTGGMGAYSPTPFYTDAVRIKTDRDIIENFLRGLKAERLEFRGVIYFGLMITNSGPQVLEFNVRLGDPETQAVLPLIDSDLYETFLDVARGELGQGRLDVKPGAACTVVMASKGYPGSYQTGFPIRGLEDAERESSILVFHAGTKKVGSDYVTAGGRVLAVTGLGKTLGSAVVRAYQGVKKIIFKEAHFRTDIAGKALGSKSIADRIKRMKIRHTKEEALVKT